MRSKPVTQRRLSYTLDNREFDTVVASLRHWQRELTLGKPIYLELAEEHGEALTSDEIDELIARIN